MKKTTRKILNYSIAVIVSFCCICIVGAAGIISSDSTLSTPVPIQDTQIPLSIIIALTSSSAQTQTAISNPAPLPTTTLVPTFEIDSTPTTFIFELQTNVAQPTEYIYSTNTPFSLETSTLEGIQSTLPSSSGDCEPAYPDVCINANPRLSCAELRQKGIFHFRVPGDDPLGYDKDDDGIGCE